jgi:hypothetical protein
VGTAAFEWVLGRDDWIAVAVAVSGVVTSALGILVAPPAALAFCDEDPPPLHSRPPVVVVIVVIISPRLGDDYDIAMMCLPP